jgi:hypothetical protein
LYQNIHWDGKILPEIFGAGNVNCLPVLVSDDGVDKLFGVPKLSSGTEYNKSESSGVVEIH